MNLIPFLAVQNMLPVKPRIDSGRKYLIVVLFIFLSYIVAGSLIVMAGRILGFQS